MSVGLGESEREGEFDRLSSLAPIEPSANHNRTLGESSALDKIFCCRNSHKYLRAEASYVGHLIYQSYLAWPCLHLLKVW
jgi:hypothetical protein